MTQDGKQIAKLSLATSTTWQDKITREWHKRTEWHHVVIYKEKSACWIKDNLAKGDPVYVEGTINYRHWKDRQGSTHKGTHIVVSGNGGRVQCLRSKNPKAESRELLRLSYLPESFDAESSDSENFAPENLEEDEFCPETCGLEDLHQEDPFFEELLSLQSPNQSQEQNGETS